MPSTNRRSRICAAPPLPAGLALPWQQALLDVELEAPIESASSLFSLNARTQRLGMRVVNAVRFFGASGVERVFQLEGEAGVVALDPRWHQSLLRFLVQGFEHILDGADHLLFLLCLVVPFRRQMRALVWIVTAFTAGHSVTLIASAYGLAPNALWFPPLVETLIALSIFYMTVENVVCPNPRARWAMAFGFGLVHGFGFSFALQNTLQFAGAHVLTSLLSFNVGIELGQLLVLVLLVPALNLLFRYRRRTRRRHRARGHRGPHGVALARRALGRVAQLRSLLGLRRRLVELNQVAAGVDENRHRHGAHLLRRTREFHALPLESLEFRLDVVDLECRRRNPLFEQRLLIRARRGVCVRLERQLGVAAVSRAHGQPAKLAHWNVERLHEAQDLGVETQCLGLIVDENRAELDSHGVLAGFVTRWTLAAHPRECFSKSTMVPPRLRP